MKMKLVLSDFAERYFVENATTQYCAYCLTPKAGRLNCCEDINWIAFKDLDDITQRALMEEEYDQAFGVSR